MTLGELIERCAEIELRIAKIYAGFSILLGDRDERFARFWEGLSQEEWRHHVTVAFGRSICARQIGLRTPVPGVRRASLERVLRRIAAIERATERGEIDLRGAFEAAIEIERGEANAAYGAFLRLLERAIDRSGRPHLRRRLAAAEEDVEAHVAELVGEMKRVVGDPALVRKARRTLA